MMDHATPGQLIVELLDERGWTKRALAIVLEKDESTINKIIAGKGTVTPETALALEDIFGIDADRFLELQRKYDLAVARISAKPDRTRATRAALFGDLPVGEMVKRGWITIDNPQNTKAVEAELVRFFGVASSDQIEILPHAAKKTEVNGNPTPAQMAWLYRVKSIAEELMVPNYSQANLEKALPKLHALTGSPEEVRHVPRILAECGVRLVIVQSLATAKIDGVCFWLDDTSPVIGLTIRFDRIDNFWFVLRHEIEHVRLGHGKAAMILDAELEGEKAGQSPDIPEEERLANSAAQNFCVPVDKLESFVVRKSPFFSERDFLAFAKILRIHPGILAGQLQRRTGRYDRFRQHLANIRSNLGSGVAIDGWGDVYPLGE
ncbi:plasmid maintenance system antidote protein [Acetobacter aceti NRIC 0242]|uniref:Transcriptional regulator n=1 Tax=Acetobacter aceti NBRC 14818 TaxID=887700 RepID=A0AB33IGW1_ACEAC|nr:HigA family addiction module antitoxin [Acetobacter aceti]BCK77151.1 transcriptional regulator [Acetobacter aceti NBRC 14818]GAN57840.1 plasmid maintenance system antidote protein [Acetobacter aceti NBRC 14818]GBO81483.1 plasmid maintenance system antidote protein [Acetobacter aceti NRIC 0242]